MTERLRCQWCGILIAKQGERGRQPKYCSDAHKQAAYRDDPRKKEQRYCLGCAKRIPKGSRSDRIYCDSKCRQRHRTRQNRLQRKDRT